MDTSHNHNHASASDAPPKQSPGTVLATEMIRRMRQLNYSRRELAMRAGLSRQTIHSIEAGRCKVQPQTLAALDEALKWPSGTAAQLADGNVDALSFDPVTETLRANAYRWQIVKRLETLTLDELEAMILNSGWDLETSDS